MEVNSRWNGLCDRSTHFKAAGELLLSSFQHRAALNGCNELAWVAHFLGTLSLGGHFPDLSRFTMDGYRTSPFSLMAGGSLIFHKHRDAALQGARAIPQKTTKTDKDNWVRPDLSVGICASGSEWDTLRAGKAILPLDIVEFKRNQMDSEEGCVSLFLLNDCHITSV